MDEFVQGFLFMSGYDSARDGSIVRIVGRQEVSDESVLEHGPVFVIRFGDDHEQEAYANELSPWYPH